VFKQPALGTYISREITRTYPISGRYVYVLVTNGNALVLCEVEVWSSDCSFCPINSTSESASTSINNCICPANYAISKDGACTCDSNFYKFVDSNGTSQCITCPINTVSEIDSKSISECNCKPGFLRTSNGICEPCQANTYRAADFRTNKARTCGPERNRACNIEQSNTL